MLDGGVGASNSLPAAIVVGRTLSSYTVGGIQNNQETITYTVYNEQANPETGVLLTDTLSPGETILSSSVTLDGTTTAQLPDQSGQNLAWSLQPINGYDRESVAVTVNLPSPIPSQLDTGAHAFATLDAGAVTNATPAATLRPGTVDPSLLASTPDANTTDPFIQEEAAKLNYDPQQIFNFVHTQIGYNSYTGSLRGARGTLWSSAGNALDVASLGVALDRASGIPAQYVQGTLSQDQASQLILSMFPNSFQTVGYIPAGTQTADPANDPQLQSETQNHYWFQFDAGNGMQDADPLMPGATIGQTFTTSTGTFTEVPDALRQKTTVRLNAEIMGTLSSLAGPEANTKTVLEQTFNDVDLVGRPLSIGNFVNTTSISGLFFGVTTNTYSPYIDVGDEAYPDGSHDEFIRGTDYQEYLTNFAGASQLLTGLFLDVDLSGPGVPTQTYERTLVDRIGFAARQGGSGAVGLNASGGAPISDADITTINVLPGLQSPAALPPIVAQIAGQRPLVTTVSGQAPDSTTVSAMRRGLISAEQAELVQFALRSQDEAANLAGENSVAAYFDRPGVTIAGSHFDRSSGAIDLSFDLRREDLRVVPYPGQNPQAEVAFNFAKGLIDNVYEQDVVPAVAESTNLGTFAILQQALAQNIPLVTIGPDNLPALDALNLPAEAKARIAAAIGQGAVVAVPAQTVTMGTAQVLTWLEMNPTTGAVSGVLQDGTRSDLVEYKAVDGEGAGEVVEVEKEAEQVDKVQQVMKALQDLLDRIKNLPNNPADKIALLGALQKYLSGFNSGSLGSSELRIAAALAYAGLGLAISRGDPPLPDQFFDLNLPHLDVTPNPASGTTQSVANFTPGAVAGTATTAALAVDNVNSASWSTANVASGVQATTLGAANATVTDAQGHVVGSGAVGYSGAALALAISGTDQFSFQGAGSLSFYGQAASSLGVAGDWTSDSALVAGNVTITLSAAGLTLNGQPLPTGTYTIATSSASFTGAGPTSTPSFAGAVSVVTTVGTIQVGAGAGNLSVGGTALDRTTETTLTGYSGTIDVSANGDGTDSVAFNSGNAGNILQVTATPAMLTTDQNTPVTFQTNVQTSFADTYTLTAQAPPGWTVTIDNNGNVTATPAPGLQGGTFPIQIIAQATTNPDLVAQSVVNVTITPTQPGITLAVQPDTQLTVPFQGAQLPTAFRAVIHNSGPTADTFNLTFPTVPDGFTLLNSGTTVTIPAGETGIVGVYLVPTTGEIPPPGTPASFTVTATSATNSAITQTQTETFTTPEVHAVTQISPPAAPNASPGSPVTTTITLQNQGNVSENTALDVSLPPGLTASGLSPVTLGVGQSASQTLTLTPAADAPLNSTLTATVTLGPASTTDVVSVLGVVTDPPSAEVGQTVDISAQVLSGVIQARSAQAFFSIKDQAGNVVFSSVPVPIHLSSVTSVATVDLGSLDTTGLSPGSYTINVTIADSSGQAIPGASGQGQIAIGSPVTASLSGNPETMLPGNGTVTNTLTITGHSLLGAVQTDASAMSIALKGSLAYVGGAQSITIVDVTNPASPQVVKTFGGDVMTGGGITRCQIAGGNLIVASEAAEGAASFNLLVYSLADPLNPQLLSNTPVNYRFLSDLFVGNSTAFATTEGITYTLPGTITDQFGDFLAIDLSDPAHPALAGVLSNTEGPPNGGDTIQHQGVAITDQLAYVVGSTSTGGDTQTGAGQLQVVDTSDPTHLSVVKQLSIPGMVHAVAIATQGNRALVVGSTGGRKSPFNGPSDNGLTGTVALAVLDITDPDNPQLVGNTLVTDSPVGGLGAVALGNGKFAVSGVTVNGAPALMIVDTSGSTQPVVSTVTVPADVNNMAVVGDDLYTTSSAGLRIYRIETLTSTPVTAEVQVPKNTGVTVVPNSFSIAPTQIIDGADFQTLVWNLTLAPGDTSQTITWQSTVSNLLPDEVRQLTLDTTVQYAGQGTTGGLTLPPLVVAGVPATQTIQIPVQVVVPGAQAIANAAVAAGQLGNTDLAARFNDLSIALTNLVQSPTSAVYQSQAQASLAAVVGLLGADPYLAALAPTLTSDGNALAQAAASAVQTAVSNLGNDLTTVGTTLADEAAHNFRLALLSNSQVGQPQTPTTYPIAIQNTGSQTTTYDLSINGVPSGVTPALSQSSVTLAPGQATSLVGSVTNLSVTITSNSTTELAPFNFTVQVTAEGASEISRTASGAFTARKEFVSVISVDTNPPFTDPGGQVTVSARVLNAVNQEQQAQVSYVVTDPNGQVVFTSQPPVPITLGLLTTLTTVPPGLWTLRISRAANTRSR